MLLSLTLLRSSVPYRNLPALHHQTRQLNLWGFQRELRGPNVEEGERYYHKYFKRGKLDELQLIQRTEIKRKSRNKQLSSYDSGHGLPLSQQIASMAANQNDDFKIQGSNPQQTGDITQGASFLTGLKGQANLLAGVSAPGGGPLQTTANCFTMQMKEPGNMISYKTSSLPPSMLMQSQMMQPLMINPQMMNQQMFHSQQMLMQQQMMGEIYSPTGAGGSWNCNQFNRGMLSQQLTAMASNNVNDMSNMYYGGFKSFRPGQNALGYNLSDRAHSTLVSVSGSTLTGSAASNPSSVPAHLDVGEEHKANEGYSQMLSQHLPRVA